MRETGNRNVVGKYFRQCRKRTEELEKCFRLQKADSRVREVFQTVQNADSRVREVFPDSVEGKTEESEKCFRQCRKHTEA